MKVYTFCQGELGTNSIALVEGDECIVVDIPYGATDVEKFVAENKLKVIAVFLTHGHFDHVGGVQHFVDAQNRGDIPIYIDKADLTLANNAARNRWSVKAENCFPSDFVEEKRYEIGPFVFDVIKTAGHTAGSVCYVFQSQKLILSGDTLFCGGIGRTDFPESEPSEMRNSLNKIKRLNGDYKVVCGHGPSTSLDAERRTNPYLI